MNHSKVIDISYKRISLINRANQLKNISEVCREYGVARSYYYRWVKKYNGTQKSLRDSPRGPRISPRRTCERLEKEVLHIRKQTNYGARRIKTELRLKKIELGIKAVSNILRRAGVTKSYHKRRYRSKSKYFAPYPGYEIQIDVMEIGKRFTKGHCYQFTAIDTHTKLRFLAIYEDVGNQRSLDFLEKTIQFFPFLIKKITTDNASIFTHTLSHGAFKRFSKRMRLHPFTAYCIEKGIEHRLIRPGCPRMNCFVERSHRTDRQEFYWKHKGETIETMIKLVKKWQDIYNTLRLHSSLNYQTPLQYFLNISKECS